MLHDIPKRPVGHTPGKEFVDTGDPWGMKLGIITRVDEVNLKADVKVITGGGQDRYEIDLTQSQQGPRSFWGGVPEVNSIVILGYRRRHKQLYEAIILGYIPGGQRLGYRFDPFSPIDPSAVTPDIAADAQAFFSPTARVKRLKLRPGDVGGMSANGAEFTLTKDVRTTNRAGDFFELRDTDRTWVGSSIHRVENESGITRISGPIRRGSFFTYPDITKTNADGTQTLIQSASSSAFAPGATGQGSTTSTSSAPTSGPPYYGTYVYQTSGPGFTGGPAKFADANGVLLDVFNNTNEFPPVTYSNGRQVFYTGTYVGANLEDPNAGAGAEAFVEYRIEIDHTSDLTQQVREEIDGFGIAQRAPYIEVAHGTTVGNDTTGTDGQRVYNRVTKPKIFDDFNSTVAPGSFTMEEVPRSPTDDLEVFTTAGAFLYKITPPFVRNDETFACSISKQGKVFLNVPGSTVERYPSGEQNVSMEANLLGALKFFIGASAPSNTSIQGTLQGGIKLDIGSNSDGRAIDVTYHSSVQSTYQGTPDTDNMALTEDIQGNRQSFCTGVSTDNVAGAKTTTVNGSYQIFTDRFNVNTHSGYSLNTAEYAATISGKTQINAAEEVIETIVTGGKTVTILAGDLSTTVATGAVETTVGAGAMTDTVGADYSLSAGGTASFTSGGALTQTAGGAVSVSAGGAISQTAALAATFSAGTTASLIAPQILLGGPAAVLGIARGTPTLPVGSPTLDPLFGIPLQGCAVVRSV